MRAQGPAVVPGEISGRAHVQPSKSRRRPFWEWLLLELAKRVMNYGEVQQTAVRKVKSAKVTQKKRNK